MYAVIRTGGKQYRVQEGDELRIEKLNGLSEGDEVVFDDVLMVSGDEVVIGRPVVEGASVKGEILGQNRAKKIVIFKSKRRKGYRKKRGHRQSLTHVKINEISV